MQAQDLSIPRDHVHKLLSAADGDTALLYLYLQCGNGLQTAPADLRLSEKRVECAAATLRQLGVWTDLSLIHI